MQTNEEFFLKKLGDEQLLFDTKEAVKAEREATSVVVKYFREIHSRELYLKFACASLFQFAVKELGYCEGSAQSRINAMKLVIALPEVEKKIESGELSLTAASNLQSFFQLEKKSKKEYSRAEKLEVVSACYSKSTREVKHELLSRNPDVVWVESVRQVSRDRFELKFTVTDVIEEKIRKLKSLFAHSCPNMTTEELLRTLVELGLEKFDPVRKAQRVQKREAAKHKSACVDSNNDRSLHAHEKPSHKTVGVVRAHETASLDSTTVLDAHEMLASEEAGALHAHETLTHESTNVLHAHEAHQELNEESLHAHEVRSASRYIPAKVRHAVWARNEGRGCEYKAQAGEACGSQFALQIDHVVGFARGGENRIENLRVVCAKHNRFLWRLNLRSTVVREAAEEYGVA